MSVILSWVWHLRYDDVVRVAKLLDNTLAVLGRDKHGNKTIYIKAPAGAVNRFDEFTLRADVSGPKPLERRRRLA